MTMADMDHLAERAFLFAVGEKGQQTQSSMEESLKELKTLVEHAGGVVVGMTQQLRDRLDQATAIGRGKLEEIRLAAEAIGVDVLICDDELSGAQVRNIEALTGLRTIDRTTLILDIFAKRAQSAQGRLQVELAQYQYRLPRLKQLAGQLSRQGGGIGTRGPGETRLETDRRHIQQRIQAIKKRLTQVAAHQMRLRNQRQNCSLKVAIIGYTNAGKSTLMQALTRSDVYVADQLFATLDPTVRTLKPQNARQAEVLQKISPLILIDTIGFIHKLPHLLINAFKSTLQETLAADLLLLVVDGSDPNATFKYEVTQKILSEIGAAHIPQLVVLNKMDCVLDDLSHLAGIRADQMVQVSAKKGLGLVDLTDRLLGLSTQNRRF